MGLKKLFGLVKRSYENPSVPLSDPEHFLISPSRSGVQVSESTALTYDAVFRAVSLISRGVAGIPINTLRIEGDRREEDHQHPAYRLLRFKANKYQTIHDVKIILTMQALLRGNGYAFIDQNQLGQPVALIPMDAGVTWTDRADDGRLIYRTSIRRSPRTGQDTRDPVPVILEKDQVFHLKGIHETGDEGLSVIGKARDSIGLGIATERHGNAFFARGARPSMVLEHPGKMRENEHENFRKGWEKIHRGVDNHFRTAILENGMKLNAFSMTQEDSQFVETLEFRIRVIANWFGVPPHKLGSNINVSYASLEQENQAFLDDTIDPWLKSWEHECWDKLLSNRQQQAESHTIEFERKELLRMSAADRTDLYASALDHGWMSVNEVRRRENLNPIPGGDEFNAQAASPAAQPPTPAGPDEDGDGDPTSEEPTGGEDRSGQVLAHQFDLLEETIRRFAKRLSDDSQRQKKVLREDYLLASAEEPNSTFLQAVSPVIQTIRVFDPEFVNASQVWRIVCTGLASSDLETTATEIMGNVRANGTPVPNTAAN